jgi:hypothetical protein
MESEDSLPSSKESATDLFPESDLFSPYTPSYASIIHVNIILPSSSRTPNWSLAFMVFYENPVLTPIPRVLHALPISFF